MSVEELLHASARPRFPGPFAWGAALLVLVGCDRGIPEAYRPDLLLQEELGLTEDDEVHRVELTGAASERATPDSVLVHVGGWVEFFSADWRVHEVHFGRDGLAGEAVAFMEETDQLSSPPLVDRGARFLIDMEGAPPGRYPYRVEGNGPPGHGVVVVVPNR